MLHHDKSHKVVELKCGILWDGTMIFFIFLIRNLSRHGVGTELLGGGGVLVGRWGFGDKISVEMIISLNVWVRYGRCYKGRWVLKGRFTGKNQLSLRLTPCDSLGLWVSFRFACLSRLDGFESVSGRTDWLGDSPSLPGDTKHCILPPLDPRSGTENARMGEIVATTIPFETAVSQQAPEQTSIKPATWGR